MLHLVFCLAKLESGVMKPQPTTASARATIVMLTFLERDELVQSSRLSAQLRYLLFCGKEHLVNVAEQFSLFTQVKLVW
jgi:hypothetical protein